MKVILVLALVAAATAASQSYQRLSGPANYDFGYNIQETVDLGHQEARSGDNTKGNYFVVLPNGRRQNVNYYVNGGSGYVADVQYSGDARPYVPTPYSKPTY